MSGKEVGRVLELGFEFKKFRKMALGVILQPLIVASVFTCLTLVIAYFNRPSLMSETGGSSQGSMLLFGPVIAMIVVCALIYYRRIVQFFKLFTASKRLTMTIHRDGMTGVSVEGKAVAISKQEISKVILSRGKDAVMLSVYVDRQYNKFLRKVHAVAYDFYITAESADALEANIMAIWGSHLHRKSEIRMDGDFSKDCVWSRN